MTLLASRSNRLNNVLAYEAEPGFGYSRKAATVVIETGMDVGAVLVRQLSGGAATAVKTGTGNGTIGTITVGSAARAGDYIVKITSAVSNGANFAVFDPLGGVVTTGAVGTAFSAGGLGFTISDGSTDFAVGDYFTITVTGTSVYAWVEAADVATLDKDVVVLVETEEDVPSLAAGNHSLAVLCRQAGVKKSGLEYKDTLNATQKAVVEAALEAKGIAVRTGV